jgi:Glycosyl transferase family 2
MPRYAAMTMVHREMVFLKLWVQHYAAIVGRENLFILVHGGADEVMDICQGCRTVFLPRHRVNGNFDRDRFRLINAYAAFLLTQYDGIVAGDVDELLFVDPDYGLSIFDLAAQYREHSPVVKAFALNLVEQPEDAPFTLGQPLFAQRRSARLSDDFCKPLIAFADAAWVPGFHAAAHPPVLPEGLYLAHLHYMAQDICDDVARGRAETLDQNPEIRDARAFKADWWGKGRQHSRKYIANAAALPEEPLDAVIAAYLAELRRNEVVSRWGPNYRTLTFDHRPQLRVRVPDRFVAAIPACP